MRAILTDSVLLWTWSASRFETGFRILHVQSAICDNFHFIFGSKMVFKSANHSSGSALAWLLCCLHFTNLQYAATLQFPVLCKKQCPAGEPRYAADQGLPCFVPCSFLSLPPGDSLLYRLYGTSVAGYGTDQTPCETVQMRSWKAGLCCWRAVRLWCMGLEGEGHWGGQQGMGREYRGRNETP